MKHSFIDKYSYLDSPIHRIDPRVKLVTAMAFILFIISTEPRSFTAFALYGVLIVSLVLLSKVPLVFVFKRSLVVIPFVLMIAIFIPFVKEGEIAGGYSFGSLRITVTYDGLTILWNVLIKSYLSILCMILLSTTTKISNLLKALESMKVPRIITMILSFMYRYSFVLVGELLTMKRAKDSRTVGGSTFSQRRALASMVGALFLRSYQRGERVYLAMASRGYDGSARTLSQLHLRKQDIGCGLLAVALFCLVRCVVR